MKKSISILLIVASLLSLGSYAMAKGGQYRNQSVNIDNLPKQELSQKEKEGLLLMREEEKLAKDVYAALYQKWNHRIFNNISSSEQQHTSRVKDLLDKYQLDDPVASMVPGKFNNPEMQKLYNQLVKQGSSSHLAALKVGAEIEDLDIKDLKLLLAETDNKDIQLVYQNLYRGSRNHMRSFNKQLLRSGVSYKAKYISQTELQSIISSPMERGNQK
ncbi:MAG: DUF2202 domain-containing protein [Desulfobacteraceae bacterium]|jgi:hypothetical protein